MARTLLLVLAALLPATGFALAGWGEEISPSRADELRHMVKQDCGSCHGLRLTGGLGKPITPEALEGYDPEGLAGLILDGMPGTAMPPWRPLLSEAEARWIADYLLEGEPR
ncbi:MAG: c-type cytochrome [Paracoccus sp. (in: a-proteobacteria)]